MPVSPNNPLRVTFGSSRNGMVKLAAPELGGMAIYANVIALDEIGEDNVTHLMLWSAREPQAASSQMAA